MVDVRVGGLPSEPSDGSCDFHGEHGGDQKVSLADVHDGLQGHHLRRGSLGSHLDKVLVLFSYLVSFYKLIKDFLPSLLRLLENKMFKYLISFVLMSIVFIYVSKIIHVPLQASK